MATKRQQRQAFIRYYKEVTGEKEIDMHDVAKFAASKGWMLPAPADPLDLLAKEFSQSAREETRTDSRTGKPYRANHAISLDGTGQNVRWFDIDEAPRKHMLKSLVQRREQMVGDALHMSFDQDHWNAMNPQEEPIQLPLDLTPDVEWRKNGEDDQAAA
jgi:hypothetical protein